MTSNKRMQVVYTAKIYHVFRVPGMVQCFYGRAFLCIRIIASNDKFFMIYVLVIYSFSQRVLPVLVVVAFS